LISISLLNDVVDSFLWRRPICAWDAAKKKKENNKESENRTHPLPLFNWAFLGQMDRNLSNPRKVNTFYPKSPLGDDWAHADILDGCPCGTAGTFHTDLAAGELQALDYGFEASSSRLVALIPPADCVPA